MVDSIEELDDSKWYAWYIADTYGPPLPPYQLEIVMKDGRSFFIHSGNGRNEETRSICINVWDIRALNSDTTKEIMEIISKPGAWQKVSSKQPYEIHPLLSIGRLRCSLDEIMYIVEWWSRAWIIEKVATNPEKHPIGFTVPERKINKFL